MGEELIESTTRPELLKKFDPDTLAKGELYPGEMFWKDHSSWLKERGYILRARYQPDWVASWVKDPSKLHIFCEDGKPLRWYHVIDATRTADGKRVVLKKTSRSRFPTEVKIAKLFSTEPLASDPRNHCAPLYEVLEVPDEDDTIILVTPLLQKVDMPPFDTIGEAVEMFRQVFEGLRFMHNNNVSHCDCKLNNIMMDSTPLYSVPPHPEELFLKIDYSGDAMPTTRTRKPVKYYLIDFGLSKQFEADASYDSRLLSCGYGGDRTVPEFAKDEQCDPFPVDVYCTGNMIREYFLEGDVHDTVTPKRGFEFMKELIADMVQDNPKSRPNMDEVVQRFDNIVRRLSSWKLRSRVAKITEPPITGIFRSMPHWKRQIGLMLKRVPPIPKP